MKKKKKGGGAHCLFISRCYTKTFKWCSSFISLTSRILNFLKLEGKKKKGKEKVQVMRFRNIFFLGLQNVGPTKMLPLPPHPIIYPGESSNHSLLSRWFILEFDKRLELPELEFGVSIAEGELVFISSSSISNMSASKSWVFSMWL